MIYANGLHFGENREELLQMNRVEFPYACYFREMDARFHDTVPWHWHKSVEIDYIVEGGMTLATSERTLTVKKGDICLINSGELHAFFVQEAGCRFYAHLFHATFLSGVRGSLIEQKYFLPILGNDALTACVFPGGADEGGEMARHFRNAVELDREQPEGYELFLREELTRLWYGIYAGMRALREQPGPKKRADAERVKRMIQYIHEHYSEPVLLGDIARAAQISRQECMRCFQRTIHTSPVAYLTEYRVRMAAEQLLYTDEAVITVSEMCGFSSSSYFAKVFRRAMGCPPKEYRKMRGEGREVAPWAEFR